MDPSCGTRFVNGTMAPEGVMEGRGGLHNRQIDTRAAMLKRPAEYIVLSFVGNYGAMAINLFRFAFVRDAFF